MSSQFGCRIEIYKGSDQYLGPPAMDPHSTWFEITSLHRRRFGAVITTSIVAAADHVTNTSSDSATGRTLRNKKNALKTT